MTGMDFKIKEVAERIRELREISGFTVEEMASLLLEEYEVEEDIALEDCKLIAECWEEMGLLQK